MDGKPVGLLGMVVLLASLIAAGSSGPRQAIAGPLDSLFATAKVEADPNKDYELTESNGPWLVMACSFSGPHAYEQCTNWRSNSARSTSSPHTSTRRPLSTGSATAAAASISLAIQSPCDTRKATRQPKSPCSWATIPPSTTSGRRRPWIASSRQAPIA